MKKNITLYNALFPFWLILFLNPKTWLWVLPGNFIIDSIVLFIAIIVLKVDDRKKFFLRTVWKVFSFGLLSDIIGAVSILTLSGIFKSTSGTYNDLYLTIPALIISAVCIFVFNYYISFRTCNKNQRFAFALTFAIITAPYTFLI